MATKKTPSNTAAAALKAMQNAAKDDLRPPAHVQLSAEAEPYFADIVRACARDEWNEMRLTVAAQLAECMADQQAEADILRMVEGRVIENQKGTPVANPRMAVVEQLARRQMALTRTLQMGGRVPGGTGDVRNKAGARKVEAGARAARAQVEAEEDDLLA